MQTAQMFTSPNHSWQGQLEKSKGKGPAANTLIMWVGACLHLRQGCERGSSGPWVCRRQLLIQAAFFPQNLSRGEYSFQNMTLMGSHRKQMPPVPCFRSGTRYRFLGRVACSSCWNGWGQDSARQHLSLAGSIQTNSTEASHGLRMVPARCYLTVQT